jgi:transposase
MTDLSLGSDPPGVVYAYAPGRGAIHGLKLLESYKGIVHCEGYAADKTIVNEKRPGNMADDFTLAFCWVHLRRQLINAQKKAAPAPASVVEKPLRRIAQLYAIEAGLRGRRTDERREGRQIYVRPLAKAMGKWLAAQLKIVSDKSDTAQAIRYAQNLWAGLTLYLEYGRIEMDTNAVERAGRPIKLTAKNSLFASCDDGAEHWSMLASFIETCKLNQVNAESWLADVLTKLVNGWPEAKLEELLPWADAYTKRSARELNQKQAA